MNMPNFMRVLLLKDASFRAGVEEHWGKAYLDHALQKAREDEAEISAQSATRSIL